MLCVDLAFMLYVMKVGRVIVWSFVGDVGVFICTVNCKDYVIFLFGLLICDDVQVVGGRVYVVGKIGDIFLM